MNTLIAIGVLAVLILVLEIINLRKLVLPITIVGLLAILVYTVCNIQTQDSYFNNMFVTSKYATAFSSLFIALTIPIVALSKDFYSNSFSKIADYMSLKLFLLMGAICMVSFGNMAMFFLGLEILSITLYILCGSDRTKIKSNEAAMKYFLLGSFASGIVLFGIALVYGATGSFDIQQINQISQNQIMPIWYTLGVSLIFIGMLFKIAAVPFHFWAPDVYQGAPTLTTAIMSTLVKVTAMATLFKLCSELFTQHQIVLTQLIIIIAILTMSVGNIMAITQSSIKRLLAYSGISHAGVMMIALTTLTTFSATNLFYYACAYGLAGIAAFSVVLAVTKNSTTDNISGFKGLAQKSPILTLVMTVALLSLGGIPIFAGFFAKFFLFSQALENGFLTLVIFAIINSFISIYYYLKVIIVMFTPDQEQQSTVSIKLSYKIVGLATILINIIIGLYPDLIIKFIS
ncbi:NADH-quinone oxidoreductase subunit N [Myroides sp. LJL110]